MEEDGGREIEEGRWRKGDGEREMEEDGGREID